MEDAAGIPPHLHLNQHVLKDYAQMIQQVPLMLLVRHFNIIV
jgi:hypothetical protein